MTEFIMNGRAACLSQEPPFIAAFIEALLWTETCHGISMAEWNDPENVKAVEEGDADGSIPGDAGYADIHQDSLTAIRKDCEAWQAAHADLLAQAYQRDGYGEAQAGHDYWLTRNGHGAGFWDRDALKAGGLGDKLTDACLDDPVHVFFAGHVVHGDAPFIHVDI